MGENICKSHKNQSIVFMEAFEPKDLSREQYEVMLNFRNPQERQKYILWSKENEKYPESMKLVIAIDQIETKIAKGTIQLLQDKGRIRLQIFSLSQILEGRHCVKLLTHDGLTVMDEFGFSAPPRISEPSKQPILKKLHPIGGVSGDKIVIYGKNFGHSIDKISIEFLTNEGDNLNYWKEEILGSTVPYTLTNDKKDGKGFNEMIQFSIPGHPKLNRFTLKEWFLGKTVFIRVLVNYLPTKQERFTILNNNWKLIIIFFSILLVTLFIGSLAFITTSKKLFNLIVLDTKTNMYSLSKIQAFAWFVTLLGSYLYVVISSKIILHDGKMPDFNYSLIGLLGISVGGLLTSNLLDIKTDKTKRKEKPLLIDLVRNIDGEIQLPKLQLLGFTAISIIVYIFNLLQSNILAGLPDIPDTLYALLLISQGGFIGGKVIGKTLRPEKPIDKNKKEPTEEEKQVEEATETSDEDIPVVEKEQVEEEEQPEEVVETYDENIPAPENESTNEIKHIGQVPVDLNISSILKYGASGEDVKDLQSLLYQLGFGGELNWEKYKDDGIYGASLAAAVKAFAEKNSIDSDGSSVSQEIGDALIERFDQLDELQQFSKDLKSGKFEEIYRKGSGNKVAIAALQTLLNELGYGEKLNWEKYKNDGFYGKRCMAAVKVFAADNGIESDGIVFTEAMAKIVVDKLTPFYGSDWDKPTIVQEKLESGNSPLAYYSGNRFVGKKLLADKRFFDALDRINRYASKHDVLIHVTSSFRPDANVKGAVVKPSRRSNHMVGHAFDFNVRYGDGYRNWANNAVLKSYPNIPTPVKAFIDDIRKDIGLRWGGDFQVVDAIHIDDGFNLNTKEFDKLYKAIRA
ncbi:MAG: peptidoglycan-binding protein [Leptospiraceae bacterium]|nr:peptidoglycan-binding protein [Leptospiraceae bacterium]